MENEYSRIYDLIDEAQIFSDVQQLQERMAYISQSITQYYQFLDAPEHECRTMNTICGIVDKPTNTLSDSSWKLISFVLRGHAARCYTFWERQPTEEEGDRGLLNATMELLSHVSGLPPRMESVLNELISTVEGLQSAYCDKECFSWIVSDFKSCLPLAKEGNIDPEVWQHFFTVYKSALQAIKIVDTQPSIIRDIVIYNSSRTEAIRTLEASTEYIRGSVSKIRSTQALQVIKNMCKSDLLSLEPITAVSCCIAIVLACESAIQGSTGPISEQVFRCLLDSALYFEKLELSRESSSALKTLFLKINSLLSRPCYTANLEIICRALNFVRGKITHHASSFSHDAKAFIFEECAKAIGNLTLLEVTQCDGMPPTNISEGHACEPIVERPYVYIEDMSSMQPAPDPVVSLYHGRSVLQNDQKKAAIRMIHDYVVVNPETGLDTIINEPIRSKCGITEFGTVMNILEGFPCCFINEEKHNTFIFHQAPCPTELSHQHLWNEDMITFLSILVREERSIGEICRELKKAYPAYKAKLDPNSVRIELARHQHRMSVRYLLDYNRRRVTHEVLLGAVLGSLNGTTQWIHRQVQYLGITKTSIWIELHFFSCFCIDNKGIWKHSTGDRNCPDSRPTEMQTSH